MAGSYEDYVRGMMNAQQQSAFNQINQLGCQLSNSTTTLGYAAAQSTNATAPGIYYSTSIAATHLDEEQARQLCLAKEEARQQKEKSEKSERNTKLFLLEGS